MRRIGIWFVLVFVAGAAGAALYRWPADKRPPVPIDRAYQMACDELKAKAGFSFDQYYCAGCFITCEKKRDSQTGVWNFIFEKKGSPGIMVYVTMYGVVSSSTGNQ